MTEIVDKSNGKEHVLRIEGHAGYAKAGEDIVCAGISTLGFTLVNQIEALKEQKKVDYYEFETRDGFMEIKFVGGMEAQSAFDTVKMGFLMLMKSFPENICISWGEI